MKTDDLEEPNVMLIGGPAWVADSLRRIRFAHRLDAPIKLLIGNRYEHFRPTSRRVVVEGRELTVFEWAAFTQVAE